MESFMNSWTGFSNSNPQKDMCVTILSFFEFFWGARDLHCLDIFSASGSVSQAFTTHGFRAGQYDIQCDNRGHDIVGKRGFLNLLRLPTCKRQWLTEFEWIWQYVAICCPYSLETFFWRLRVPDEVWDYDVFKAHYWLEVHHVHWIYFCAGLKDLLSDVFLETWLNLSDFGCVDCLFVC